MDGLEPESRFVLVKGVEWGIEWLKRKGMNTARSPLLQ